jgi:hypothetical protein
MDQASATPRRVIVRCDCAHVFLEEQERKVLSTLTSAREGCSRSSWILGKGGAVPAEPRDDIGRLADKLADKNYRNTYHGKVQEGLDPEHKNIPQALIDALNGLTADGLAAVSQVNRDLEAAKVNGARLMQFPV